jgi:hypothetical protein
MKTSIRLAFFALFVPAALAGCSGGNGQPREEKAGEHKHEGGDDKVKANRAKLSPEDQALMETQDFCAIETENRLGVMGPPIKVMIKDQPVFLCCKSCQKKAEADPDKTLAKVEELKAKHKSAPQQ